MRIPEDHLSMSAVSPSVQFVSLSNVIIDDIVLWTGQTHMGALGGSGMHAVMGMRVWHDHPLGLVAYLGTDFPDSLLQDLNRLGVASSGLVVRKGVPTPRAWQLFEEDGQRTEIFRTSLSEFLDLRVDFHEMSEELKAARGYHFQWGKSIEDAVGMMRKIQAVNARAKFVFEPIDDFLHLSERAWRPLLERCEVFLPNWDEAHTMTNLSSPEAMAGVLQAWGANHVVIRMGAQGIWVQSRAGNKWRIPAIETDVVDVTGAGNAFCGGLLTGIVENGDILDASLRGLVSASFAIEQVGCPRTLDSWPQDAARRYDWASQRAREM